MELDGEPVSLLVTVSLCHICYYQFGFARRFNKLVSVRCTQDTAGTERFRQSIPPSLYRNVNGIVMGKSSMLDMHSKSSKQESLMTFFHSSLRCSGSKIIQRTRGLVQRVGKARMLNATADARRQQNRHGNAFFSICKYCIVKSDAPIWIRTLPAKSNHRKGGLSQTSSPLFSLRHRPRRMKVLKRHSKESSARLWQGPRRGAFKLTLSMWLCVVRRKLEFPVL